MSPNREPTPSSVFETRNMDLRTEVVAIRLPILMQDLAGQGASSPEHRHKKAYKKVLWIAFVITFLLRKFLVLVLLRELWIHLLRNVIRNALRV